MKLLHISDLHFGAISANALKSIERFIESQPERIDLIVVTGDWTQRARKTQFRDARRFLRSLSLPVLSVPGNHDIPLYNWILRFIEPLKNYRHYIEPFTMKSYSDQNVAIWGPSTVSWLKLVEGICSEEEFERAFDFFRTRSKDVVKILACHHPLINPRTKKWIVGMNRIKRLKPDMILSGHSHLISLEYLRLDGGHKTLCVVSGTSTSWRLRGEVNSFHVIDVKERKVEVVSYFLSTEGFIKLDEEPQLFVL